MSDGPEKKRDSEEKGGAGEASGKKKAQKVSLEGKRTALEVTQKKKGQEVSMIKDNVCGGKTMYQIKSKGEVRSRELILGWESRCHRDLNCGKLSIIKGGHNGTAANRHKKVISHRQMGMKPKV